MDIDGHPLVPLPQSTSFQFGGFLLFFSGLDLQCHFEVLNDFFSDPFSKVIS